MPRVVKDYDERRNEILDVAWRLFYGVGYGQTTINAIIVETGIAKGTFYHYFQSKAGLLDGLVERLSAEILAAVAPTLETDIPAVEKFRYLYRTAGAIKMAHVDLMIPMLRVLFDDENIVLRHKMLRSGREVAVPLYARIIGQGVDEGVFETPDPEGTARIIVDLWYSLSEPFARLMLAAPQRPEAADRIMDLLRLHEQAVERILGAAPGSLNAMATPEMDAALREMEAVLKQRR